MSSDLSKPNAPATTDRDALAILGFADSLDGRQLVAECSGDLLPYEDEFEILAELIEGKAQKNHDSRGFRVKLRVVETNAPNVVKLNREYTLWFFDQHKTLPNQVLAEMVQQRIVFAATYAGYDGDPLEELADGTPKFKAAPTLLEIHKEVEPLGVKMRFKNTYLRTTRNGKKLHKLSFEMV
jgi:hypothetical protein